MRFTLLLSTRGPFDLSVAESGPVPDRSGRTESLHETEEAARAFARDQFEDPPYPTGWSADDMRGFAGLVAGREREPGSVRVAALVSRTVEYGLARMYEAVSQGSLPPRHAVFRKESEALAWLRRAAPRASA